MSQATIRVSTAIRCYPAERPFVQTALGLAVLSAFWGVILFLALVAAIQ